MLLLLFSVPVIVLVAFAHRLLQACAPSNVLIRRVRDSRRKLRTAAGLGVVAFGCVWAMRRTQLAIEAGAPEWLNLVVLVLAWDAIKFAALACLTSMRCVASALGGLRLPKVRWSARGTRRGDGATRNLRARNPAGVLPAT